MKLAEAPKQIAIKKALVGSIGISRFISTKYCAKIIDKGERIIATAALETKAEVTIKWRRPF